MDKLNPTTNLPEKNTEKVLNRSKSEEEPIVALGSNAERLKGMRLPMPKPIETQIPDFDTYSKNIGRDFNVLTEDIDRLRAAGQSGWKQAGNMLTQAVVNEIGLATVEGLADIADLLTFGKLIPQVEEGYGNVISNRIRKAKDAVRDSVPIYQLNPGEFDPGDSGWWFNGLVSTASTLGLLIPAAGTTRILGMAAKFIKGGIATGKLTRGTALARQAAKLDTKLANLLGNSVTTAVLSRQAESHMEAAQVYEESYEEAFNEKLAEGLSEEEAEREARVAASEAAAFTYRMNWFALATDIPQYLSIGKVFNPAIGRFTRNKSNILKGKKPTSLKDKINKLQKGGYHVAGNVLSEGFEEGYQFIIGEEGKRRGLMSIGLAKDEDTFIDRLGEYTTDGEFWTGVFFGGIGGGLFSSLSNVQSKLLGQDAKAKKANLEKLSQMLKQTNVMFNKRQQEALLDGGYAVNKEQFEDIIKDSVVNLTAKYANTSEGALEQHLENLHRLANMSSEELSDLGIQLKSEGDTQFLSDEQRREVYEKALDDSISFLEKLEEYESNPKYSSLKRKNISAAILQDFAIEKAKNLSNKASGKKSEHKSNIDERFNKEDLSEFQQKRFEKVLDKKATETQISFSEQYRDYLLEQLEREKDTDRKELLQSKIDRANKNIEYYKESLEATNLKAAEEEEALKKAEAEAVKNMTKAEKKQYDADKKKGDETISDLIAKIKSGEDSDVTQYAKSLAEESVIKEQIKSLEEERDYYLSPSKQKERDYRDLKDHIKIASESYLDALDDVDFFNDLTENLNKKQKASLRALAKERREKIKQEKASKEAKKRAEENQDPGENLGEGPKKGDLVDPEDTPDTSPLEGGERDPSENHDVTDTLPEEVTPEETPAEEKTPEVKNIFNEFNVGAQVQINTGKYSGKIGTVVKVSKNSKGKDFILVEIDGKKQSYQKVEAISKVNKEADADITNKEYNDFIDKGIVTQQRINSIAEKAKNNKPLSQREAVIFNNKTSEINNRLKELKELEQSNQSEIEAKKAEIEKLEKERDEALKKLEEKAEVTLKNQIKNKPLKGYDVSVEKTTSDKKQLDENLNEIGTLKDVETVSFEIKKEGNLVGFASFWKDTDGKWYANNINILDKNERRKGIMSYVYNNFAKAGYDLKPSKEQTEKGKSFWESINIADTPAAKINNKYNTKIAQKQAELSKLQSETSEDTSGAVKGVQVDYTPKDKQRQTYTVVGNKIFNSKGEEVFKKDSSDKRKIFANLAVLQGRADVVEHEGNEYVVNDRGQIMSTDNGDIMKWEENDPNRIAILEKSKIYKTEDVVEDTFDLNEEEPVIDSSENPKTPEEESTDPKNREAAIGLVFNKFSYLNPGFANWLMSEKENLRESPQTVRVRVATEEEIDEILSSYSEEFRNKYKQANENLKAGRINRETFDHSFIIADLVDENGDILTNDSGEVFAPIYNLRENSEAKEVEKYLDILSGLKDGDISAELMFTGEIKIAKDKVKKENNINDVFGEDLNIDNFIYTDKDGVYKNLDKSDSGLFLKVAKKGSKILKGNIFYVVKSPFGQDVPILLNRKRLNPGQSAKFINALKIYANNKVNPTDLISKHPEILNELSKIFEDENIRSLISSIEGKKTTVRDAFNFFINESFREKGYKSYFELGKNGQFKVGTPETIGDPSKHKYANIKVSSENIGSLTDFLNTFLTETKRMNVDVGRLKDDVVYRMHILDNNILNTDASQREYKSSDGKIYNSIFAVESFDDSRLILNEKTIDSIESITKSFEMTADMRKDINEKADIIEDQFSLEEKTVDQVYNEIAFSEEDFNANRNKHKNNYKKFNSKGLKYLLEVKKSKSVTKQMVVDKYNIEQSEGNNPSNIIC